MDYTMDQADTNSMQCMSYKKRLKMLTNFCFIGSVSVLKMLMYNEQNFITMFWPLNGYQSLSVQEK